jgi:hypothetical protein
MATLRPAALRLMALADVQLIREGMQGLWMKSYLF